MAAVKSAERLPDDSLLVIGNIGIGKTDSCSISFKDFNEGFSSIYQLNPNERIILDYFTKLSLKEASLDESPLGAIIVCGFGGMPNAIRLCLIMQLVRSSLADPAYSLK